MTEFSFYTLLYISIIANILTLCQPDGPVIKYPQFPDVLNALNVQPQNILLWFDTVDYAPEPKTAETVYR